MTSDKKKTVTRLEVSSHNNDKDCWIILHGKAYNVTKYLDEHPGGPEIIADLAGQDATEEFEDTGHSKDARALLEKFFVADVEGGELTPGSGKAKSNGGPNLLVILVILALVAGAVFVLQQ